MAQQALTTAQKKQVIRIRKEVIATGDPLLIEAVGYMTDRQTIRLRELVPDYQLGRGR